MSFEENSSEQTCSTPLKSIGLLGLRISFGVRVLNFQLFLTKLKLAKYDLPDPLEVDGKSGRIKLNGTPRNAQDGRSAEGPGWTAPSYASILEAVDLLCPLCSR